MMLCDFVNEQSQLGWSVHVQQRWIQIFQQAWQDQLHVICQCKDRYV